MKETHIEFDMDGRSHAGYVCEPAPHEGRLWPGVLVFHGGGGLGAHERERAHRLANLGYLAFAPDLFGEPIQSREQGMALINSLRSDTKLLRSRVYAALAQLCANPGVDSKRLAAIGFCLGGMCALELARSGAPLRAAISFHGASPRAHRQKRERCVPRCSSAMARRIRSSLGSIWRASRRR